ncbi:hypothetical protein [Roseiconus lacunae]|uniref:hypothetical protein n=1 Tax=Roseiconus lacunae TaxID=2605694 RepID=UPI001E3FE226|nr:hypothetical protein [Roseiconus lacunae]MCD0460690.1 hypothetical protein [Roseiconus lacunae]
MDSSIDNETTYSDESSTIDFALRETSNFFAFLVFGMLACVTAYVAGAYLLQGVVYWVFPSPEVLPASLQFCWWFSGTTSTLFLILLSSLILGFCFLRRPPLGHQFKLTLLLGFLSAAIPAGIYIALMTPEQLAVLHRVDRLFDSPELQTEWIVLKHKSEAEELESESYELGESDIVEIKNAIQTVNRLHSEIGFSRQGFVIVVRTIVAPVLSALSCLLGGLFGLRKTDFSAA